MNSDPYYFRKERLFFFLYCRIGAPLKVKTSKFKMCDFTCKNQNNDFNAFPDK